MQNDLFAEFDGLRFQNVNIDSRMELWSTFYCTPQRYENPGQPQVDRPVLASPKILRPWPIGALKKRSLCATRKLLAETDAVNKWYTDTLALPFFLFVRVVRTFVNIHFRLSEDWSGR